jgi:hypothetical protein
MSGKLYTLPDTRRVRVASQRRYILLRFSSYDERWHIIRRSDSLDVVRRLRQYGECLLDTATGETIR